MIIGIGARERWLYAVDFIFSKNSQFYCQLFRHLVPTPTAVLVAVVIVAVVCVCRKMVTGLSFVVHSARVINNRFTMLTRNVQVFLHLIIANKLSLKIIKRNAFHNLNVFTSNQLLPIKSIGYLIAFNKKFPVF